MRRGELWWAELGVPVGSEPGSRRPVVVVQSNAFISDAGSTVTIVPLTSQVRRAGIPGNVRLPVGTAGLEKVSVVNMTQVTTVNRARLVSRIGQLPAALMSQVDDGLRLFFGL